MSIIWKDVYSELALKFDKVNDNVRSFIDITSYSSKNEEGTIVQSISKL